MNTWKMEAFKITYIRQVNICYHGKIGSKLPSMLPMLWSTFIFIVILHYTMEMLSLAMSSWTRITLQSLLVAVLHTTLVVAIQLPVAHQ